jgi:hypothetical protein
VELLTARAGKEFWLHQLERPFAFKPPFRGRRYVSIVFSNDQTVTDTERHATTRALFSSGCRYGVFAGHACGAWARALNTSCIESDPDYHPADEMFTLTTSHEGESVEDVMVFGLMNTSSGPHEFDRFLVLFVGPRAGLRGEIQKAIKSA